MEGIFCIASSCFWSHFNTNTNTNTTDAETKRKQKESKMSSVSKKAKKSTKKVDDNDDVRPMIDWLSYSKHPQEEDEENRWWSFCDWTLEVYVLEEDDVDDGGDDEDDDADDADDGGNEKLHSSRASGDSGGNGSGCDEPSTAAGYLLPQHPTPKTTHQSTTKPSSSTLSSPFATYSVHRGVLCSHSEYFRVIFSPDGPFRDSNSCPTKIMGMPKIVAEHFDVFLDQLYRKSSSLPFLSPHLSRVTHRNVVPVLYLAEYFDVKWLRQTAKSLIGRFLVEQWKIQTVIGVVDLAKSLGMEAVFWDEIAKFVAKNPKLMQHGSAFSSILEVWRLVPSYVNYSNGNLNAKRDYWSQHIVDFLDLPQNTSFSDHELFVKLTSSKMIPCNIESERAAMVFMEIENDLGLVPSTISPQMTDLQKRCVPILLTEVHRFSDHDSFLAHFGHLPQPVIWELIEEWSEGTKLFKTKWDSDVTILELYDAHDPDVNGIYYRTGRYSDDYFEKEGRFRGRDATYRVHRVHGYKKVTRRHNEVTIRCSEDTIRISVLLKPIWNEEAEENETYDWLKDVLGDSNYIFWGDFEGKELMECCFYFTKHGARVPFPWDGHHVWKGKDEKYFDDDDDDAPVYAIGEGRGPQIRSYRHRGRAN